MNASSRLFNAVIPESRVTVFAALLGLEVRPIRTLIGSELAFTAQRGLEVEDRGEVVAILFVLGVLAPWLSCGVVRPEVHVTK